MKSNKIPSSELVLNSNGNVYHLDLNKQNIANNIILVGDQDRVEMISQFFDSLEFSNQNREFKCHTGHLNGVRISVISTGIGTDNIDIIMNELFAVFNIDLETRELNSKRSSPNIFRIGTSGAIQKDIKVGSFVVSNYGLGLDGLMYYYDHHFSQDEILIADQLKSVINWPMELSKPYVSKASQNLLSLFKDNMTVGITASGTGFYGPQGRDLLGTSKFSALDELSKATLKNIRVTNFDMETSAIYGLGNYFGFQCCTCNVIIANRKRKEYLNDHQERLIELIKTVLNKITNSN